MEYKIYPSNVIPCEFRDATVNSIYIFDENFELVYALVSNRIKKENIIEFPFALIYKEDYNYYYNILESEKLNDFTQTDNIYKLFKQTAISNSSSRIKLNEEIFKTLVFEWSFYNLPSKM